MCKLSLRMLAVCSVLLSTCFAAHAQSLAQADHGAITDRSKPAQSIRDKLAAPVDIDLHETPLADLPGWLQDRCGVRAELDRQALAETGMKSTLGLNFRLRGASLRSALNHLLRQYELAWETDGDLLVITTPEAAEKYERVAVYDVGDLLTAVDGKGDGDDDNDQTLLDTIQVFAAPDSWPSGNSQSFTLLDGKLSFPQSDHVHQQVALLLKALRTAKHRAANARNADWSSIFAEQASNRRLREELAKPTQLVFSNTPLDEAARQVSTAHAIPVLLDGKTLAELSIATDTPLAFDGRGLPLARVLRHLLAPKNLLAVVRDEALVITEQIEAQQSGVSLRVYPVGDLVASGDASDSDDPSAVMDAIRACRASTWEGGPGQASYFPASRAVVVSQLDDVHEAIDTVLADLRKTNALRAGRSQAKPATNRVSPARQHPTSTQPSVAPNCP